MVEELLRLLAAERPVIVAVEDVHWIDPTSLLLLERLLGLTEEAALLLVVTQRPDPDHTSSEVRELSARRYPHRSHELVLEALGGDAERELLHGLVGADTLPPELEHQVLEQAEGNPFFLEELVRSLADAGALVRANGGYRFDHKTEVEIPATVEQVILARVDRLPAGYRTTLTAASVLGRQFGLPLLEGVVPDEGLRDSLRELQRLDLLRESRRWPQPEFRFKHVLIQEAVYRTIVGAERRRLHREAAEWLERRREEGGEEALGILARHWLAAQDESKAIDYLTRAGDKARQEYALSESIEHYRELLALLERRGESREVALVLFKLALALHASLRFAEANEAYQRAFEHWEPPAPAAETAELRIATSFLPNDLDPASAIAWPNIQLCMQLFDRLVEAWPERTIVPSLAEQWEIADDGLRYVFRLRPGLAWSDGAPLTAHDVEFGIKRVLDPERPGSSVAIYYVLENGQDYALGRNCDADRIGVRALDDLTVEFRLAAPAPYFMSVMNRPDGGPQPRHAIEALGDSWTDVGRQVVSGPFRIAKRTDDELVLERRPGYANVSRSGNVRRVVMRRAGVEESLEPLARGELDMITVRYTPRMADQVPRSKVIEAVVGPAAWTGYLAFDHANQATGNVDFRRALAHAIDREQLASRVAGKHAGRDRRARPARSARAHSGHRPALRSGACTGPARPIGRVADGEACRCRAVGSARRGDRRGMAAGALTRGRGADVDHRSGMAAAAAVGGLHRTDRRHRLAAGVLRSRVLPAPAPALRVEDERGRLRLRPVRRADRARTAGAERPVAPRALPRGGPRRRRRPGGPDPDRVRAQHGVRPPGRLRMVGVREVVGGLRRPRRVVRATARRTGTARRRAREAERHVRSAGTRCAAAGPRRSRVRGRPLPRAR